MRSGITLTVEAIEGNRTANGLNAWLRGLLVSTSGVMVAARIVGIGLGSVTCGKGKGRMD